MVKYYQLYNKGASKKAPFFISHPISSGTLILLLTSPFGLYASDISNRSSCFTQSKELTAIDKIDIEQHRREIRAYIIFNYRNIVENVIEGNGIYLDDFYNIIQPPCNKALFSKEIKELLKNYNTISNFAINISNMVNWKDTKNNSDS